MTSCVNTVIDDEQQKRTDDENRVIIIAQKVELKQAHHMLCIRSAAAAFRKFYVEEGA